MFKEAWEDWIQTPEISEQIQKEALHFKKQEQEGDILEKMFKSARYYYRKKTPQKETPDSVKQRKQYIGISPHFIHEMDIYIQRQIKEAKWKIAISPEESFQSFSKECETQIQKEITDLTDSLKFSQRNAEIKIKKTYKNRYYLQTKSIPKESM
jgi:hypothetical protein